MNQKQITEMTIKVEQSAQDIGLVDAWLYHRIERLQKCCESPIEVMLGAALLLYDRINGEDWAPLILAGQDEISHYGEDTKLLVPQYGFRKFRIDWALRDLSGAWTFIECDGHDFHERTKEQAAKDRSRDREFQEAGIPIFRFTGSEIHKSAIICAQQVWGFAESRIVPPELRVRA